MRQLALIYGLVTCGGTWADTGHSHGHTLGHAQHHDDINQVDSDTTQYDQGYYDNYYNNDPAYQNYYDGQYQQNYPEQQFVAKQEDELGFIDRLFLPANRFGIPLPIAITLFIVDVVISAGFLLFPKSYKVPAESRRKREARGYDTWTRDLCQADSASGHLCRVMQSILSTVDCLDVARCEVAQLSESDQFPMMAKMISPFVPADVQLRYKGVTCSTVKCAESQTSWFDNNV